MSLIFGRITHGMFPFTMVKAILSVNSITCESALGFQSDYAARFSGMFSTRVLQLYSLTCCYPQQLPSNIEMTLPHHKVLKYELL